MLIEKLESKIKLAFGVSLLAILSSMFLSIAVFSKSVAMVSEAQQKIYVLNGEIPIVANRTDVEINIDIEAKSHIYAFHQFFFTLPPDDEYINYTLEKAMYLVDESGLKQKNALQEKGFYNSIMSQSANFSIMCDSIAFDKQDMSFIYYGTQRIERKSSILRRSLTTEGHLRSVARTINNPHGLIITDYKTINNRDIEYKHKSNF